MLLFVLLDFAFCRLAGGNAKTPRLQLILIEMATSTFSSLRLCFSIGNHAWQVYPSALSQNTHEKKSMIRN
jgi:hypothetical protein